jgi:hypothetical protein
MRPAAQPPGRPAAQPLFRFISAAYERRALGVATRRRSSWLRRGAQLPEQHSGQQPGGSGRDRAGLLGGQHGLVPGMTQDPPRHATSVMSKSRSGSGISTRIPALIAARPPPGPQP